MKHLFFYRPKSISFLKNINLDWLKKVFRLYFFSQSKLPLLKGTEVNTYCAENRYTVRVA
jgi:hypothetical protein